MFLVVSEGLHQFLFSGNTKNNQMQIQYCMTPLLEPTLLPAFNPPLLFQEGQRTNRSAAWGFYNLCCFNFLKTSCNVGKQVSAQNYPFDGKAHRILLLSGLLLFPDTNGFSLQNVLRADIQHQPNSHAFVPSVLHNEGESFNIQNQAQLDFSYVIANLVATCLLAKWHVFKDTLGLLLYYVTETLHFLCYKYICLFLSLKLSLFILIDLNCNLSYKPRISTVTNTRTGVCFGSVIIHCNFHHAQAEVVLWAYLLILFHPSVSLQSSAEYSKDGDDISMFLALFFSSVVWCLSER